MPINPSAPLPVTPQARLVEQLTDIRRQVAVNQRSFLAVQTGTGIPTTPRVDGTFYGDEATNALWLYIGGAWLCVSGVSGTAAIPWPGANQFSSTMTITHGLGYVPRTIQLTAQQSSALGGLSIYLDAPAITTSSFTAQAHTLDGTQPAAGNHGTLYWWAQ